MQSRWGTPGMFEQHLPQPAPIALRKPGIYRFGPLIDDQIDIDVYVPSRTRAGTGTRLPLGTIEFGDEPVDLDLPDLQSTIVTGRVESMQPLPFERIAVVASATHMQDRSRFAFSSRPNLAGVMGNGTFRIDLPAGTYCVQLADVLTGIVFHTEAIDFKPSDEPLVLRPKIHWLEVECISPRDGPVVSPNLRVSLACPRGGEQKAFLDASLQRNDLARSMVEMPAGTTEQRWLVPAGQIQLEAYTAWDKINPRKNGWSMVKVRERSLKIESPTHHVQLRIPAPPSDEQILNPRTTKK